MGKGDGRGGGLPIMKNPATLPSLMVIAVQEKQIIKLCHVAPCLKAHVSLWVRFPKPKLPRLVDLRLMVKEM